jgi:hypothetical protein
MYTLLSTSQIPGFDEGDYLPTVIIRYILGTMLPAYWTISYKSAQCCFPEICASRIYVDKYLNESNTAISTPHHISQEEQRGVWEGW